MQIPKNDIKRPASAYETSDPSKLDPDTVLHKVKYPELADIDGYLRDLEDQASHACFKRLFEKRTSLKIKLYDESIPTRVLDAQREIETMTKQLSQRDDVKYWAWITINPPPDIQKKPKLYEKCIEKAFTKKWIQDATAVIEQRAKELPQLGLGAHIHLRVRRDGKRPDHLLRELYNTFKPLLPQVPNEAQKKKLKRSLPGKKKR